MNSSDEINALLQSAKAKEKPVPEQEADLDDELDDFCLVDESELVEPPDYDSFPWLHPKHPLYFPPTQSSTESRWERVDKFSVENWYPFLKKHTFASSFVTLNYDDIQFLMGNPPPIYDSRQLEETFNNILTKFSNKEAFMRMSTRSPKDSKFLFEEAASIMSQDRVYWSDNSNKNQQLVSFVSSMLKAMKVKDGRKIVEMISQSPRVFSDLLALVSSSEPSACQTKVILREWYDIRPDHEFRIFVSRRNRKESVVTAIAQYFHFLHFDQSPSDCFNFLEKEQLIAAGKKFEKYVLKSVDPDVAKFLNFSSEEDEDVSGDCIREYIIDLALIPIEQYHGEVTDDNLIVIGKSAYVMVVIELNPFAPAATGSATFNWKNDLPMLWGQDYECPYLSYRVAPREDLHTVTLLPSGYESVIENALTKRLKSQDSSTITQRDRLFTPEPIVDSTPPTARVAPELTSSPSGSF